VAPTTSDGFNVLSVDLLPVACLQLRDVLFEFDSSFPRPTLASMLKEIPPLREKRKNSKGQAPLLSIFGHADPTGDDSYNKQLSGRRATAIYAVLTHDTKLWESLYDAPFGGDDWKTKNVTASMRTALGEPSSKPHKAMVPAYLALLFPTPLQKTDFLGQGADPKGKADYQGCSEFNPLLLLSTKESQTLPKAERDEENARNRRVVIFMYRAGMKINPKLWPCPTVAQGTADCVKRFFGPPKTGELRRKPGGERREFEKTRDTFACRFYDRNARLSPCEAPPPPVARIYNITNVHAPTHIASGKEKIKITYDIVNNGNQSITTAKLEILRKSDSKVLKTIDLTATQFTEGPHGDFEWDGAVDKSGEFPDGFATIEHSDYVAKVTVNGDKGEKHGSTEIKVELKEFTIELGKKEYLKDGESGKRSKAVMAQITTFPATSLQKLMLTSNLFAVKSSDMEDQTAFDSYMKLWSGGPRIPIVATATVIDSTGKAVRAGKAMGRARVVWDYADPAQTIDTYLAVEFKPPTLDATTEHGTDSQGAKPYVDKARTHKSGSVPKGGDNAHTDFDGKRTDNPGPPVFHGADGGTQNFPFKCPAGATRKWAGLAPFEKDGDEEARAGAIFRPSRMAGDNYKLTAYLDIGKKLDVKDDKPPSPDREVALGEFEVWRQVNLIEHYRKNSTVTGAMPSFAEYFLDAYVEVKDDSGSIKDLTKAFYDAEMTAAIAAVTGNSLLKKYALRPVSHWDGGTGTPTGWIAAFHGYNTFKNNVKTGEGLSNAELTTLLTNNELETQRKYVRSTQYYAADLGELVCKKKVTKDGLTIMQFDRSSEQEHVTGISTLNGMAVFTRRNQTGFLLTKTDAAAAQTPAHEIGHCMFLPHAPRLDVTSAGARNEITSGGGITPDFHDGKNWNCLMSYNRPRPGFCGLCILRLRGYDGSKFDKNGPK
jgi:hypothetical protein